MAFSAEFLQELAERTGETSALAVWNGAASVTVEQVPSRHQIKHTGYDTVLAVPRDMEIAGYKTEHGNTLRLWDAKSPTPVDMSLFSSGQYLKAVEQKAMAESISKVLYPEDNHYEGMQK